MKKFIISLAIITALTIYITVIFPENSFLLCVVNLIVVALYIFSRPANGKLKLTDEQSEQNIDKQDLQPILQPTDTGHCRLERQGETRHANIILRIKSLMETDKIYQEAELTLHQLGNILQVPAYLVSQALNDGMNRNFYELVNGYRVEEAKRLLLDTKSVNYTVLSVGFEAGFNSKTTFNTVFKKFTGLTPSEYRNKFRHLSIAA